MRPGSRPPPWSRRPRCCPPGGVRRGATGPDPSGRPRCPHVRRDGPDPERGARWLSVGRMAPNKAIEDVLMALLVARATYRPRRDARDRGQAGHRVLHRAPCTASWPRPDCEEAVTFRGHASDDDLAAAYDRADVLVVASAHEGFGVPLIEAMSVGLPIVASPAGALPEVVGRAGVVGRHQGSRGRWPAPSPTSLGDPERCAALAEAGRAQLDSARPADGRRSPDRPGVLRCVTVRLTVASPAGEGCLCRNRHDRAWEDWGSVDPLYAILTDPKYRHGGGDRAEFLDSGRGVRGGDHARSAKHSGLATGRRRALDFGCGVGRVTAPLSTRFDEVVGLDVSPEHGGHGPAFARSPAELLASRCSGRTICASTPMPRSTSSSASWCCSTCRRRRRSCAISPSSPGSCAPGGALVVQLPSTVPPPTVPAAGARGAGLRTRAGNVLRRLGVSPQGPLPAPRLGSRNDDDRRARCADASHPGRQRRHRWSSSRRPTSTGAGRESCIYFATRAATRAASRAA